jgi:thiamine-monophosphate kinase
MRESELLAHIERAAAGMGAAFPRVLVGPGDDCAVVESRPGDRMVVTVDQVVEGRHFVAGTDLDLVARKGVARSLSDLAAMACRPVCGVATAVLPDGFRAGALLSDRLHHWANHWGCPLVGGDLASGGEAVRGLVLTVTAIGELLPGERAILRSGARVGDGVYVTGCVGGGVGGGVGGSFASGRHLRFEPRVEEGLALRRMLGDGLHAMIDLSDGLGRDAGRVARASGVRIELEAERVPLGEGVGGAGVGEGEVGWRQAMGEGEDYELCFTSSAAIDGVEVEGRAGKVRITRVGWVRERDDERVCVVRTPEGGWEDASEMGWEHSDGVAE